MKNKKGGERILSIYLFIIYVIVALGIVSGVLLVHGSKLDVRMIEAGILSDKVIDCLVEQGNLGDEVLAPDFNLLDFCNLDFDDGGEEQYAVKIELFNFDFLEQINDNEIKFGKTDFLEFCGLEGDKIPKCVEKQVYVLKDKQRVLLKVTGAVGKVGENA